ncbi:oligopeptide transporter, OPT family [Saccharobesus litoralis]|uniref:Oligopeptide transporter, OPT family n=1 Tax=Saccharobesus litoralis TaxID=2172099 RepID=A0A2S0VTD6_9ALTE|nr:oligopeptide transporter, OPT family [Saccharobesus litoralis]AWB67474.1 oligopeptide transporter, OPT family [Saccharobesus litoralis]
MDINKQVAPPLIPADQNLAELTIKSVVLGIALSMLLAAANAYIGLLVGLTVSASIPAAAVSMGVLRLFKRSNILENNMVQTSASAGESLVAGIIFTLPALVLMHHWHGYEYWPLVSIALVGGILGVIFTIPLRHALIVKTKLTFPEGVATSEVLKTGNTQNHIPIDQENSDSSRGLRTLLQAAGIGALFKLAESGFGMLSGWISGVKAFASNSIVLSGSLAISPALIGVGYIIGLNIAILVFLGGVIGTLVGVPLNWYLNSEAILIATGIGVDSSVELANLDAKQIQAIAYEAWEQNRRIGVGAMIIGGLWSLICLAKPLTEGIKASFSAYKASFNEHAKSPLRTEFDTPINYVIIASTLALVPLFFIFKSALDDYSNANFIAGVMTLVMFVLGFLFSSVAGYMAGLVGSSNNPVSGVTIATVIISALLLLQLMGNEGVAAKLGPVAVIFLAGLICSSAAIAGDNMQDLKCGHLLGATPWKQQLYQVIGVIAAAFIIPVILNILDAGYGIGRPALDANSQTFLAAPQASLMKDLATGIFGAGINWQFIYLGMGLAIVLILVDEVLKRTNATSRMPVLAVAVGIYLPMGLSLPILIGGVIAYRVAKRSPSNSGKVLQQNREGGILLASGLITGEALMGVVIAIYAAFIADLPSVVPYGNELGLAALALVSWYLYKRTRNSA